MLTAEQKKLVEDNIKLIYFALRKFNYPVEEYYDVAAIGLCEAAEKFDPSKGGKFSPYAVQGIRTRLYQESRKNKSHPFPDISLDCGITEDNKIALIDALPSNFSIEDIDDLIFAIQCFDKAKAGLKSKAIFEEWASGKTLDKIAEENGFSRQRAGQIVMKVRKACKAAAL